MKALCTVIVSLAVAALSAGARAENWAQWRGPSFNGSTQAKGLPETFSQTENVTWAVDLPGVSGATAIVWDDRVFVSAMEPASKKLWALCLDRANGQVRWKREMGTGFSNKMGNTGASPSPITDGKTVWFLYGTGVMTAFDLDGKQLWQRDIPKDHGAFEYLWSFGSSALLYDGRLYVPVLHGDHRVKHDEKSYLLCLDPATGKDLWKHKRVTDAPSESKQAYITPFPLVGPKGVQILLNGGDYVTGHDAATGKELWRSGNYNPRQNAWYRLIPSPVAADGVALAPGPKGSTLYAFYTGTTAGDQAGKQAWERRTGSPDVATPMVYDGSFFVLDTLKKSLARLEPRTGKTIWEGDLPAKAVFQASPTGGDGKVYCINLAGEAFVLSAGAEFKVLHKTQMGGKGGCRASIAISDGQIFIRTDDKLYCIGKRH